MKTKSYKDIKKINGFDERFKYLKIDDSKIGIETFGYDRYINQNFYRSKEWKRIRDQVIIRDNGNDLGVDGYPIGKSIVVHHINPISIEDLENRSDKVFDLNNLICCSKETHNALHYGDLRYLNSKKIIERSRNDTCPWKN